MFHKLIPTIITQSIVIPRLRVSSPRRRNSSTLRSVLLRPLFLLLRPLTSYLLNLCIPRFFIQSVHIWVIIIIMLLLTTTQSFALGELLLFEALFLNLLPMPWVHVPSAIVLSSHHSAQLVVIFDLECWKLFRGLGIGFVILMEEVVDVWLYNLESELLLIDLRSKRVFLDALLGLFTHTPFSKQAFFALVIFETFFLRSIHTFLRLSHTLL